MTTTTTEQVTLSVKLMESLLKAEHQRGFKEGEAIGHANCTALDITNDYSSRSSVHVITAKSRRELSRMVRDSNHRRSGDNPGMAYLWTCHLLRAYRGEGRQWHGVCVSSVYYDV